MGNALFSHAEQFKDTKAKIKCAGVGGGGCNAVNHMMAVGIDDVSFVAINTDAQALSGNNAPYLVQVGEETTGGLGVGGDPEIGKKAALESLEKLKAVAADTDLLFITAGMGGGTGTGVAPELARAARDIYGDKILIIGVVTRPFGFEGQVRHKHAEDGINELRKYADSTIVIPNDRLFDIIDPIDPIDPSASTDEAFRKVNEVLLRAVKGIAEVLIKPGEVNIDYNDLKKIMAHAGRALIGVGEASGKNRHIAAVKEAMTSPLLENKGITGAKGFIVSFAAADSIGLMEQSEAMGIIRLSAANDAIIKFGHAYDGSLPAGVLKITVIATGFRDNAVLNCAERRKPFCAAGASAEGRVNPMLIPAYIRNGKK
jgi:cell division protein FtsZ